MARTPEPCQVRDRNKLTSFRTPTGGGMASQSGPSDAGGTGSSAETSRASPKGIDPLADRSKMRNTDHDERRPSTPRPPILISSWTCTPSVMHVGATPAPTELWTTQQLRETNPFGRASLGSEQAHLLAHYGANCGDLDTLLISKAAFWRLTEPEVLSSISVPTSIRVNHLSVGTA
jgi:hypothetical protein